MKKNVDKVIFLDLDGVLNTATEMFDSVCVENLAKLIANTSAKIVISSSWRIFGEDYIKQIWTDKKLPGEIIGATPIIELPTDSKARGHEIAYYIESHQITNYVIIDDDNEMLPEQQIRLVLVDGKTGLSEKDIIKAINIMKTKNCIEKEWKSRARIHQTNYRKVELGCKDCAPNPSRNGEVHYYGNILTEADARSGKNFVECYKNEIRATGFRKGLELISFLKRNKNYKAGAFPNISLTNNLLRSEHIPYNIFLPMAQNKEKLAELLRTVTGLEIKEVTELRIEWPTFDRPDSNPWTGDHTAFDVYIQYDNKHDEVCGIGIEVKYTEEGYPIGKSEREKLDIAKMPCAYHWVTFNSQCFKSCETIEATMNALKYDKKNRNKLRNNHLRQLWRNHILGLGMMQKQVEGYPHFHHFLSLHLYPEWNEHFHGKRDTEGNFIKDKDGKEVYKGAVALYEDLLTDKGKDTFRAITFEKLFEVMENIIFDNGRDAKWKEYLKKRYLIKVEEK